MDQSSLVSESTYFSFTDLSLRDKNIDLMVIQNQYTAIIPQMFHSIKIKKILK